MGQRDRRRSRLTSLALAGLLVGAACGSEPPKLSPKTTNRAVIPAVMGRTAVEAKNQIRASGLRVRVRTQRFPGMKPGVVVDEHPDQGKLVRSGTVVTITVTR